MKKLSKVFSSVVTVLALGALILNALPVPIFEHDSTTLVMPTQESQMDTTRALASVIGPPIATLDTPYVHRILFKDGTSIDWLSLPPTFQPMYRIVALKTVVLVLSDAFQSDSTYGSAILIPKHAFRIGRPRPKHGSPF